MRCARALILASGLTLASFAQGAIITNPTMDSNALIAALRPTGLSIDDIFVKNGVMGQIGTYRDFSILPVSIRDGVVLSSGNIEDLSPLAEAQLPDYDPASPPARVNSLMNTDPSGGGSSEFNAFGNVPGNIENFQSSNDVVAMEVHFTLDEPRQVQFDFIFGSVEFPYWTSQFTDAFLVFLDGLEPANQICADRNGRPVQVGSSFAGLETTADQNTAFANPHAVIHHLTTTTEELSAGRHVLYFEVGDVNDQVLDSVAFISHLRIGTGNPGTDPTDDCVADVDDGSMTGNSDDGVTIDDLLYYLFIFELGESDADVDDGSGTGAHDGGVTIDDLLFFFVHFEAGC